MTIDERIEFLMQSIESHDHQIGELTGQIGDLARQADKVTGQIGELTNSIGKLVAVSNEDASAIRTLARLAEVHEKRISRIEDNR